MFTSAGTAGSGTTSGSVLQYRSPMPIRRGVIGPRGCPGRANRHSRMLAVLLAASLGIFACGDPGPDGNADPGARTSVSFVSPAARALLTRLATEGSDAVFTQSFGAFEPELEDEPFVFAGFAGDLAVAYVCDGVSGAWFTGVVGTDGSGVLSSPDGRAMMRLSSQTRGLEATVAGGVFDGLSNWVVPLEPGDGQLLRLEATAAAGTVGGVIISADGVRGEVTTEVTDGSSNTIVVGESSAVAATATVVSGRPTAAAVTDGSWNTIVVGESSAVSDAVSLRLVLLHSPGSHRCRAAARLRPRSPLRAV